MPRIPRLRGSETPGTPSSQPGKQFAPAAGEPEAAATAQMGAVPAPDAAAQPAGAGPDADLSFRDRARLRRRLRYLRRARELAFRDLGGLVFDLHRFEHRRDDLVQAKLGTLAAIDQELRALEIALEDRQPLTLLREPGIAACPRCAALHGTDASFCSHCGLPVGRGADRAIAPGGPVPAAGGLAPGGPVPATAGLAPGGPPSPAAAAPAAGSMVPVDTGSAAPGSRPAEPVAADMPSAPGRASARAASTPGADNGS